MIGAGVWLRMEKKRQNEASHSGVRHEQLA